MKTEDEPRAEARREISRRVLDLLQGYVGKGPTEARTIIAGDLVIVVLADQLTKGEHVLAEQDEARLVREMRRTFMRTLTDDLAEIVEAETGRPVITNLVDHSVLPDYAFVACVLEGTTGEPEVSGNAGGAELNGQIADAQRAITRGMVAIFKDFVGRGPEQAKTYIEGDVVATLLGRTLTRAEQVLAEEERAESVRELRRDFQEALKDQASHLVADTIDRPVLAFMSDHSIFPDYALEVFLLEPESAAG